MPGPAHVPQESHYAEEKGQERGNDLVPTPEIDDEKQQDRQRGETHGNGPLMQHNLIGITQDIVAGRSVVLLAVNDHGVQLVRDAAHIGRVGLVAVCKEGHKVAQIAVFVRELLLEPPRQIMDTESLGAEILHGLVRILPVLTFQRPFLLSQ